MDTQFNIGDLYFMLSYFDKEFKYPKIESFVFIGKNIEDEGEGDLWFFQDTKSYVNCGTYPNHEPGKENVTVADFSENDLDNLLTINGLVKKLKE